MRFAAPSSSSPHRAAMQFNQLPHDRQAKPQASVTTRRRCIGLTEAVEHVRHKLGRDPFAGVSHAHFQV